MTGTGIIVKLRGRRTAFFLNERKHPLPQGLPEIAVFLRGSFQMGVYLSPGNWWCMHIEIRPRLEDDVPGGSCQLGTLCLLFCCALTRRNTR